MHSTCKIYSLLMQRLNCDSAVVTAWSMAGKYLLWVQALRVNSHSKCFCVCYTQRNSLIGNRNIYIAYEEEGIIACTESPISTEKTRIQNP